MPTSDVAECPSTSRVAESQGATRVARSLRLELHANLVRKVFFYPAFFHGFFTKLRLWVRPRRVLHERRPWPLGL